ncbi:MAG: hypothetical protein HYX81_00560 [Chloroflexi bacterium]|nr:hypothetical protein [Chloroflexota bacterium]
MPWNKKDFEAYNDAPMPGSQLYEARVIMGRYIDGVLSGYVQNMFPEPGTKINKEHVDKAVEQIDVEWNRELRRARDKVFGRLNFTEWLDDAQKLALVQEIHEVLKPRPSLGKPREEIPRDR